MLFGSVREEAEQQEGRGVHHISESLVSVTLKEVDLFI